MKRQELDWQLWGIGGGGWETRRTVPFVTKPLGRESSVLSLCLSHGQAVSPGRRCTAGAAHISGRRHRSFGSAKRTPGYGTFRARKCHGDSQRDTSFVRPGRAGPDQQLGRGRGVAGGGEGGGGRQSSERFMVSIVILKKRTTVLLQNTGQHPAVCMQSNFHVLIKAGKCFWPQLPSVCLPRAGAGLHQTSYFQGGLHKSQTRSTLKAEVMLA